MFGGVAVLELLEEEGSRKHSGGVQGLGERSRQWPCAEGCEGRAGKLPGSDLGGRADILV